MATLNTVRAVLKDARMREQANVIQKEVRLLIEDVERLDERVGRLQKHFDQANEDVRQIRISTEKVARRGERIEEIELSDDGVEARRLRLKCRSRGWSRRARSSRATGRPTLASPLSAAPRVPSSR